MSNEMDISSEFRVRTKDKTKAIEYYENASSAYETTVNRGILRIARNRERAAFLALAKLDDPTKSMIDVGCGTGFYSLEAKKNGMQVHSVDASPGMVSRLEGKVDFVQVADIETLECDRLYERVISAGVLEFVLRPELAFRNLCKLVAPEGRLVILTPRVGLGGLFYRFEKFCFGMRINLFHRKWFERIAKEYGLKLAAYRHPLPTNQALLFVKTADLAMDSRKHI